MTLAASEIPANPARFVWFLMSTTNYLGDDDLHRWTHRTLGFRVLVEMILMMSLLCDADWEPACR